MGLVNNSFFPLFALLAFVAVVLLIEALYMIWNSYKGPEAKKIEQRLRALSASSDTSARAAVLKNRMLSEVPAIDRLLLAHAARSHARPAAVAIRSRLDGREVVIRVAAIHRCPLCGVFVRASRPADTHGGDAWRRAPAVSLCAVETPPALAPYGATAARRAGPDRPRDARGPRIAIGIADGRRRNGGSDWPASFGSRTTKSTSAFPCSRP